METIFHKNSSDTLKGKAEKWLHCIELQKFRNGNNTYNDKINKIPNSGDVNPTHWI